MSVGVDPSFLVLHALRLKGRAGTAAVAAATGVDAVEVERVLMSLEHDGLVVFKPAGEGTWALTTEGREEHRRALDRHGKGDDPSCEVMNQAYRRFLSLNEPFKALCTEWQVRDGEITRPNDHSDPAYDRQVIDRLIDVHVQALAVVDELSRVAPRYQPYRDRFQAAYDRLIAGDVSALTVPLVDSYHDVWTELHEDLLVTLGIERHEGRT